MDGIIKWLGYEIRTPTIRPGYLPFGCLDFPKFHTLELGSIAIASSELDHMSWSVAIVGKYSNRIETYELMAI
jgi:hypothetical protein